MSLKFNLATGVVPVVLTEGQKTINCEIREMKAATRDAYLDTVGDRLRLGPDGKPIGVKKFEGMQADLLTRCVFIEGSEVPIAKDVVQGWPASVVTSLYEEAQKLNQLTNVQETETVKND
jgi:hypothetical protein